MAQDVTTLVKDFYLKYEPEKASEEQINKVVEFYGEDYSALVNDFYAKYDPERGSEEQVTSVIDFYGLKKKEETPDFTTPFSLQPETSAQDITNIQPIVFDPEIAKPAEPITVKDYLSSRKVDLKSIGKESDFNPDRVLSEEEVSAFDTKLNIKQDIQRRHKDEEFKNLPIFDKAGIYAKGTIRAVNESSAQLFKNLNGAEKFIGDVLHGISGGKIDTGDGVMGKVADWIQKNKVEGAQELPDDLLGNTLAGLGGLNGLLIEIALIPGVKVKAINQITGGLMKGISSLAMTLGYDGFFGTYERASKEDLSFSEKLKESSIAGGEGFLNGIFMTILGYTAGGFGAKVTEKSKSQILGAMTNTILNGLGFGAFEAARGADRKQIIEATVFGAVLTIPSVAKVAYGHAFNRWSTTSPESIHNVEKLNIDPIKLRKESNKIQEQIEKLRAKEEPQKEFETEQEKVLFEAKIGDFKTENQQQIEKLETVKRVIDGTIEINAINKDIQKRPAEYKEMFEKDESLAPEEKAELSKKVDQVVVDADPMTKKIEPITNEIKELETQKEVIADNKVMDPTLKGARVKDIDTKIGEKQAEIENMVIKKPVEKKVEPKKEPEPTPEEKAEIAIKTHNKLVKDLQEFNKASEAARKKIDTGPIMQAASELGFETSVDKGKITITDKGKAISIRGRKAIDTSKDKVLTEFEPEFQEFANKLLDKTVAQDVKFDSMTPKEVNKAIDDIKAGKKTVGANKLLTHISEINEAGKIEIKPDRKTGFAGAEIPVKEYFELINDKLSEKEIKEIETIPDEVFEQMEKEQIEFEKQLKIEEDVEIQSREKEEVIPKESKPKEVKRPEEKAPKVQPEVKPPSITELKAEFTKADNEFKRLKTKLEKDPSLGGKGQITIEGEVKGSDIIDFGEGTKDARELVKKAKLKRDQALEKIDKFVDKEHISKKQESIEFKETPLKQEMSLDELKNTQQRLQEKETSPGGLNKNESKTFEQKIEAAKDVIEAQSLISEVKTPEQRKMFQEKLEKLRIEERKSAADEKISSGLSDLAELAGGKKNIIAEGNPLDNPSVYKAVKKIAEGLWEKGEISVEQMVKKLKDILEKYKISEDDLKIYQDRLFEDISKKPLEVDQVNDATKKFEKDLTETFDKKKTRNIVRDIIFKRRVEIATSAFKTNQFVDAIDKVTTKLQREVIPFIIEGTEIPEALKRPELQETLKNDFDKLEPIAKEVKEHFNRTWENIAENTDVLDAQQIENYVTHIWDIPKSKKAGVMNWFSTNNRFLKKRYIETLAEGIELFGLKPKALDINEIIRIHDQVSNTAIANNNFMEAVNKLGRDGYPMILPSNKAPLSWPTMDHPAFSKVSFISSKGKKTTLKDMQAKVHPDLKGPLTVVFGKRASLMVSPGGYEFDLIKAYEMIGGVMKKTQLSLSLFHHLALSETAIPKMGIIKTLRVLTKDIAFEGARGGKPAFKNPEITEDGIKHGLQLGVTVDFPVKKIQEALDSFARKWEKIPVVNTIPLVNKIPKYIATFNKKWDAVLWDHLHDGLKIFAYESAVATIPKKYNTPEKIKGYKIEQAQLINDTFGGQNWDVLMVNPKQIQVMTWGLLSADWTVSTVRQALAPTGFGAVNKEFAEVRRKAGSMFWIKSLLYYGVGMNLLNSYFREKDIQENPQYYQSTDVSPMEKAMWGNTIGHKTHLFNGRYSDGSERYMRWGKQFRELPELFMDENGVSFFNPALKKLGGKAAPQLQLGVTMFTGRSLSGFENYDLRDKKGWDWTLSAMGVMAKSGLPFSTASMLRGDKDWHPTDLAFPSSKGMTNSKAIKLYKKAIVVNDTAMIREAYFGAARNNLDAFKLFNTALTLVNSENTRNITRDLKSIEEVEKMLDDPNISDLEFEKLERKLKSLEKEMDNKADFTFLIDEVLDKMADFKEKNEQ